MASRWFLTSDWHAPFYEPRAFASLLMELHRWQPTHVALVGDIIDFYPLSTHLRSPLRMHQLQEELDQAANLIHIMRNYAPQARFYFLLGNHEERLRKFLWRTPELVSLRALSLDALLGLSREKIELVDTPALFVSREFTLTHGRYSRKRGGHSAHAELDRYGTSGASGHTHRRAAIARRFAHKTLTWLELGCVCQLTAEYDPYPDWQHGYGIAEIARDGTVGYLNVFPLVMHQKPLSALPAPERPLPTDNQPVLLGTKQRRRKQ